MLQYITYIPAEGMKFTIIWKVRLQHSRICTINKRFLLLLGNSRVLSKVNFGDPYNIPYIYIDSKVEKGTIIRPISADSNIKFRFKVTKSLKY